MKKMLIKKLFLIFNIFFVIILSFVSFEVNGINRFICMAGISFSLFLILFSSYSIKKYSYNLFCLIYLFMLIFQGLTAYYGFLLIPNVVSYLYPTIIVYGMLSGFIIFYISSILIFIQIIKDKKVK